MFISLIIISTSALHCYAQHFALPDDADESNTTRTCIRTKIKTNMWRRSEDDVAARSWRHVTINTGQVVSISYSSQTLLTLLQRSKPYLLLHFTCTYISSYYSGTLRKQTIEIQFMYYSSIHTRVRITLLYIAPLTSTAVLVALRSLDCNIIFFLITNTILVSVCIFQAILFTLDGELCFVMCVRRYHQYRRPQAVTLVLFPK
jgi:hypothetical protein